MTPNNSPTASIEHLLSVLLRGGVILSLILLGIGTARMFVQWPDVFHAHVQEHALTTHAEVASTIHEVWTGTTQFRGSSIVVLGLWVLIVLPIARVALSLALFIKSRDRAFIAITSLVLALLAWSLSL